MVSQFQEANQLQRSGKLEEAVIAYQSAIAQNPEFYWSYHNLGETLTQLGRLDEAVEAYQKAVELNPSSACSHLSLGEVLEKQGKEEEAITEYREAVDIQPNFELQEKLDAIISSKETSISNALSNYNRVQKTIKQVNLVTKADTKTSLQIVIPSFNRNHLLRRLLTQINREAGEFYISVDVFDDGSKKPVVEKASDYPNLISLAVHRYNNHGKKQYWQLVNHIFEYISKQNIDLFIYMADDIEICSGFFHNLISQWYAISDPQKIALNFCLDERTQCWTGFERVKCKFGKVEVFKTQWVDMLMLFERNFLEVLNYQIQPISLSMLQQDSNSSSGVGQQISQRLHNLCFSIYQVSEYLIDHGNPESVMNLEERKITPLIINHADGQNREQIHSGESNSKAVKPEQANDFAKKQLLNAKKKLLSKDYNLAKVKRVWGKVVEDVPQEFNSSLTQIKTNKIVIYTCVWQRPELTKIVLSYYSDLKIKLSDKIQLELLAVGSEGENSRNLCQSCGFDYLEYPNLSLSDKWEHGFNYCANYDPDAVIIVGSDDIISHGLIEFYDRKLKEGIIFIGIKDAYIFDPINECMILWKGYQKADIARFGETIGMGRCFSRILLDKLNFSLWKGLKINKRLDKMATQKLLDLGLYFVDYENLILAQVDDKQIKIGHYGLFMHEIDAFAVDIKTDGNVTPFNLFIQQDQENILYQKSPWKLMAKYLPTSTVDDLMHLSEKSSVRR